MVMRVPDKIQGLSIPEYHRQTAYYAGAGRTARADDAFARIGADADSGRWSAAGRFAGAVEDAAGAGEKAYDDYQSVRAAEAYTAFQTAMRERMYGENGIFTRQGEAAFNSEEELENAIRDTVDEMTERMKLNRDAHLKLARSVFGFSSQALPKARRYAADQRLNWANRQDMASIELNRQEFLHNADERNARLLNLITMQEAYNRYAARNGFSAEQKEFGWKKVRSITYSQLAETFINSGNLNAARKLVDEDGLWMEDDRDRIGMRIRARDELLRAREEARKKKEEQDAEEARIERGYNDVMSGIGGLPSTLSVEERKARLVRFTADMEPKLRAAVRSRGEADIDERELVRKAGVVEELGMVDRMRKANPQASGNEMIRMIRESSLSDDAKAAGIRELEREREGAGGRELSAAGLREFRAVYDARNGDMSETEARALVFDLNLNAKDRESALAYSGRGMEYSQARIDGLIGNVLGRDTGDTTKSEIYAALMKRIPAGESWDDRRIRAEIYNLAQQERGRFGSQSLAGRVLAGEGGRFRPDIPEAMRGSLNSELERSYPFFSSLPEKARQLMRQGIWLRRQYGITPEWTEEERKLLEGAGDE